MQQGWPGSLAVPKIAKNTKTSPDLPLSGWARSEWSRSAAVSIAAGGGNPAPSNGMAWLPCYRIRRRNSTSLRQRSVHNSTASANEILPSILLRVLGMAKEAADDAGPGEAIALEKPPRLLLSPRPGINAVEFLSCLGQTCSAKSRPSARSRSGVGMPSRVQPRIS
jgi:hypothetical protein